MPRGQAGEQGISKMEGVRRALAELGSEAKPLEIKSYLKREFGINMEPNMISNYKSMIKSGGNKSALIRRPKSAAGVRGANGGFSLEEIQAVKEVADRIGADKVRQLAAVL
jgi:ABC-type phosphate/phosphonate transport system substrate-binding protein